MNSHQHQKFSFNGSGTRSKIVEDWKTFENFVPKIHNVIRKSTRKIAKTTVPETLFYGTFQFAEITQPLTSLVVLSTEVAQTASRANPG